VNLPRWPRLYFSRYYVCMPSIKARFQHSIPAVKPSILFPSFPACIWTMCGRIPSAVVKTYSRHLSLRSKLPPNLTPNSRYANHCPNLCQPSTPTPETTPPSNRNGVFTLTQAQQNYARERVNQVTMKKVQDAPNMVSVTSLVNSILS
jgi:hypothetical protein